MKVLTAQQIREADAYTIKNEPISSLKLMERAANACFEWMEEELMLENACIHIFCGIGNNGGDGLVMARKLFEHGRKVKIYVLRFSEKTSDDFQANLEKAEELGIKIEDISTGEFAINIGLEDLVVDAIFGTGLNKPVSGWLKDVIQRINDLPVLKIAIDLPSGLFSEFNDTNDLEAVVSADVTLTFQQPKLALLLEDSGRFCGEWQIIDIGLDQELIEDMESIHYTITDDDVWFMMQERNAFDHKGHYGHALIAAGSYGKIGAAILSGKACLRSGIGLLTYLTPSCGYEILQSSVPEAMCLVSKNNEVLSEFPQDLSMFKVIGVGPGISTHPDAQDFLERLLHAWDGKTVLDADALNILSENKELLLSLPENSILTPHPGEFKRLVGEWSSEAEKLEKLRRFSSTYKCIVVLKGRHTCIALPTGTCYFNTTGNPGMASAGSGDVLLGMITALLGRGYVPEEAARIGVYLHGLAGDLAADALSMESMTSGDIINYIFQAFLSTE